MTKGFLFLFALSTLGAVFSGCVSAKDESSGGRAVNPPNRNPIERARNTASPGHGLKYFDGVGWKYMPPGVKAEMFTMTAEQLFAMAQEAFDEGDNTKAMFAARWLYVNQAGAELAPEARRIVAQIYEKRGFHENAFQEYRALLDAHPNYDAANGGAKRTEVAQRMFDIAGEYLDGKWFRWKIPYQERMYLPLFSSMSRTAKLYRQVVTNAPYGELAASAQYGVGQAHEQALTGFWGFFADEKAYKNATEAYQLLADRYQKRLGDAPRPNQAEIDRVVGEASFRVAAIYEVQANEGVYDQSMAERAINAFKDFRTLNADNSNLKPRLDEAQERINRLHLERVRGALAIAEFYERRGKWIAAFKYFGETSSRAGTVEGLANENSPIYAEALRINELSKISRDRVTQKSVHEALILAPDIENVKLTGMTELSDRQLDSVERVSRRIELNLRLQEAELRKAVADDAVYQKVDVLKTRADAILKAAEAELDRREAEENKK
jgi:outer membrane protein assembly factor BamD (BamD/ComL family)